VRSNRNRLADLADRSRLSSRPLGRQEADRGCFELSLSRQSGGCHPIAEATAESPNALIASGVLTSVFNSSPMTTGRRRSRRNVGNHIRRGARWAGAAQARRRADRTEIHVSEARIRAAVAELHDA